MKNIVFFICLIIFSSCSKHDNRELENEKLYDFKITANSLSESLIDFNKDAYLKSSSNKMARTNRDVLKEFAPHLFFFVYDNQNKLKAKIIQDTLSFPQFGEVSLKLPVGQYKLVIFGAKYSKDSKYVISDEENFNQLSFRWSGNLDNTNGPYSPTFGHFFSNDDLDFEVVSDDVPQGKTASITRFTSQLDLIILDTIPLQYTRLYIYAPTSLYSFMPATYKNLTNPNNQTPVFINLKDYIGKANSKFSIPFCFKPSLPTKNSLKFSFLTSTNSEFMNNIDVVFERNKITQLKGYMFKKPSSNNQLDITLIENFDSTYYHQL